MSRRNTCLVMKSLSSSTTRRTANRIKLLTEPPSVFLFTSYAQYDRIDIIDSTITSSNHLLAIVLSWFTTASEPYTLHYIIAETWPKLLCTVHFYSLYDIRHDMYIYLQHSSIFLLHIWYLCWRNGVMIIWSTKHTFVGDDSRSIKHRISITQRQIEKNCSPIPGTKCRHGYPQISILKQSRFCLVVLFGIAAQTLLSSLSLAHEIQSITRMRFSLSRARYPR